ncbi:MAG: hypothetical protein F4W92_08690 [Gammaproteobacteria bacterium]|nr:hypothetical protein [Gammaproteobacteria bacterium]
MAGLTLGVLAVLAVQHFVPQQDHATQGIAQGEVARTETASSHSLSSANTTDVGRFEQIFDDPSPAEQSKALYNAFSQNSEKELKQWWIQSQKIERASHRNIAQHVILQSLTAIDPQEALRSLDDASMLQRDAFSRTIFAEWAELHLDDAIKAAAKLAGAQRSVALEAILESRDDLAEDKHRAIAVRLEREETYHKFFSDAKALQSTADPRESWDILLTDNVDDLLQMETLAIVADTWQGKIGFEILSKIYRSEFKDPWIKRQLTATIVQGDPAIALEYAQGVPEEHEQSYLSHVIVEEWARTDPLAALAATSAFEPSSLVADLQEEIADVWARTNPYELIENIELISQSSRLSPLERAFSYIAREDPLGAIESLNALETPVGNTSPILLKIVDEWSTLQPEAATDWVLKNVDPENKQLRQSLLKEVLTSLTRQDPRKAFEIALAQPTIAFSFGLEAQVIFQLSLDGNIDLAISLLPRVRHRSQAHAYGHIARAMVKKGRTFEALELGSGLEGWEQQSYYEDVVQAWAGADPTGLYASLKDLPTSAAQTRAVSALYFNNDINPVFTNDQLEQAKSLLNPEDAAQIRTGSIKVKRSVPK